MILNVIGTIATLFVGVALLGLSQWVKNQLEVDIITVISVIGILFAIWI